MAIPNQFAALDVLTDVYKEEIQEDELYKLATKFDLDATHQWEDPGPLPPDDPAMPTEELTKQYLTKRSTLIRDMASTREYELWAQNRIARAQLYFKLSRFMAMNPDIYANNDGNGESQEFRTEALDFPSAASVSTDAPTTPIRRASGGSKRSLASFHPSSSHVDDLESPSSRVSKRARTAGRSMQPR